MMRLALRVAAWLTLLLSVYFSARSALTAWSLERPVPFSDQWEFVRDYLRYVDGRYRFWDLFSQHNEHRILTTRIVLFADAMTTDMSGLLGIGATYLSLFAVSALLSVLALGGRVTPSTAGFGALLFLGIVWGISQDENLSSPFQVGFPFLHLFALLTLIGAAAALTQSSAPRASVWLIVACLADFFTIFSLAAGVLLIFPLITLPVLLRRWDRKYLWLILVHIAGTVAYFSHYIGSPLPYDQAKNVDYLSFVLVYLGNGFGSLDMSPVLCGSALLIVFFAIFVWQASRSVRMLDPVDTAVAITLGLCFFIFAEAAATAYGRAFAGAGAASAPRYSTSSLIFGAAILACVWQLTSYRPETSGLPHLLIIGIGAVLIFRANTPNAEASDWRGRVQRLDRAAFASIVGLYPVDVMRNLYPDPESIRRPMERMRELSLGHFAQHARMYQPPLNLISSPDSKAWPPCRFSIDQSSGSRSEWSELKGWVAAPSDSARPKWIIAYDSAHAIVGMTRPDWVRPDVAAYLKVKGHDLFGFDLVVNSKHLGDSPAPLRLAVVLSPASRTSKRLCVVETSQ